MQSLAETQRKISMTSSSCLRVAPSAPLPQAPKHPVIQEKHDGTRHEEGADRWIDHKAIILKFTNGRITIWHLVQTKDDRTRHAQRQDPGCSDESQLPNTELVPVVLQRHHHSYVPVVWTQRGEESKAANNEWTKPNYLLLSLFAWVGERCLDIGPNLVKCSNMCLMLYNTTASGGFGALKYRLHHWVIKNIFAAWSLSHVSVTEVFNYFFSTL